MGDNISQSTYLVKICLHSSTNPARVAIAEAAERVFTSSLAKSDFR
jgi:hypothetical protein